MKTKELTNIENAQHVIAFISSEWYRLLDLTVDDELNDTVPSDLVNLINELGIHIEQIEQSLEEEHYKLQFDYRVNERDIMVKADYRWTE